MAITLESFEFEKGVPIVAVGDDKYKSPEIYIQEFFTNGELYKSEKENMGFPFIQTPEICALDNTSETKVCLVTSYSNWTQR